LPLVLDGMANANPIAENWFRGVVFDVVRRSKSAPVELLSDYAMDQSHNAAGRGLAMELLRREAPDLAQQLISQCLQDPSLPLREMAVAQAIQRAGEAEKNTPDEAKSIYREALRAARHPRQVAQLVERIRKLGDDNVSTASAFAMLTNWKSLAPFNNVAGVGFNTAYPPEKEFTATGEINLGASYRGKNGSIRWLDVDATGDEGKVDLAAAYDREKGAVCYLFTEFTSSETRPAQARLGCINANKVWLNGEELMANEVYHSGSTIDQYVAPFQLRQGVNRVLLKICQNEQTESWAQEWEFQFRITDATGKGLRSGD
jgi:hypothetical protein